MHLKQLTPPAAPAIALADLTDHLRLAHGFSDPALDEPAAQRVLAGATAAIEMALGVALIRQSWEWRFDRWPQPAYARLPYRPVLSVEAVEILAADGAAEPVAPSRWRLDGDALRAVSGCLPAPGRGGALVRFTAGYGDAPETIPADLRQALLLLSAHYFERRHAAEEAALAPIPSGVDTLLAPHRRLRL